MEQIIICITNDIYYDRRIQRIADSLSHSHNVRIICRKLYDYTSESASYKVDRIKCHFNKGFLFYMEFNLRLLFLVLRRKSKIVVAVDYDTLIAVSMVRMMTGRKMAFDAHEYFEESVEIVNRRLIRNFWTFVGKYGVRKLALAYTVSESIAKIYTEQHKVNFQVIRNLPLKLNRIDNRKHEKKIILYQGVLNEGRKLSMLIDSAKYLTEEFEIWLLGEGDDSEMLKAQAKSIKSDCKVYFFSWITPIALREYTSQAFIGYNLLSEDSKSYYYSLANKFFDYMHNGVPSLNNKFPEYVHFNERYDCCFVEDIENASDLASFILKLGADEDLMANKQENSLFAAHDLTWENEEKKLLALYEKIL